MGSVKAAAAAMVALVLLVPVVALVTMHGVAVADGGAALSLPSRIALAMANWFVRLEPLLATVGVGLAAVAGGMASRGASAREERRELLAWLALSAVLWCVDIVWPHLFAGSGNRAAWFGLGATLIFGFGLVCLVGSVVVAARLQSRLSALGSKARAWHVVAASLALALLGPLALVPPLGVWWHSGAVLRSGTSAS